MKSKIFLFIVSMLFFILSGCSLQNNIAVTTTPGTCPTGVTNAPYCMAVTIQSNPDGQNFITSTNYPITNLTVAVSGANNIITPSSSSTMDPNGCTKSNINPGSSCTFYLSINQEIYSVGSMEPINVTLNYTYNNNLFGGGGANYAYQFTIYEYTNLYIVQNPSTTFSSINVYNSTGMGSSIVLESQVSTNSVAMDNNTYGFVYLATNSNLFNYGNGYTSMSNNPSGVTAINNLFTSQPSPFESGISPTTMYGVASSIYTYNFASQSWESGIVGPTNPLMNVNAVSPSGVVVIANSNNIFSCNISSSSGCIQEGVALVGTIQDIGFLSSVPSGYTGLYVGTTNGLLAESGASSSPSNIYVPVYQESVATTVVPPVKLITTDSMGNLYAADINGNLWWVNSATPNIATQINSFSGALVTGMIYDNFANILYVTVGTQLYSCVFSTASACNAIPSANFSSANVVGLGIGSSLTN